MAQMRCTLKNICAFVKDAIKNADVIIIIASRLSDPKLGMTPVMKNVCRTISG